MRDLKRLATLIARIQFVPEEDVLFIAAPAQKHFPPFPPMREIHQAEPQIFD
jgi:hypothetical protein